ncbi:MAG TPA: C1 family peptidase, partial [Pirellula sp.]|nr:C1 family peptidase [Pirellula sp.]
MRLSVYGIVALVAAVVMTVGLIQTRNYTSVTVDGAQQLMEEWNAYRTEYRPRLFRSEDEHMQTFIANVAKCREWNQKEAASSTSESSTMGITPFTHLTDDEFTKYIVGQQQDVIVTQPPEQLIALQGPRPSSRVMQSMSNTITTTGGFQLQALPTGLDWRTKAPFPVSPVQNQGICGSCYAFGVTNAIQSAKIMKLGSASAVPVLSAEEIIDCDGLNHGCDGGNSPLSADRAIARGGLPNATAYPYTALYTNTTGTCLNVTEAQM